jgi:hypothetical protein
VHEHDLPQPARMRHERIGSGGRDQAVEQDDGAIGNPPNSAGEGGVARLVRPRPGAWHRVLVHRPAEGGEAAADPTVVRVAATRPRGVIDALRDDDVDRGHSDRS